MTKILYVFGEDYAASEYERAVEDGTVNPTKLWGWANDSQTTLRHDDDECVFEYRALKFGDVDPAFLAFVENELRDYDDTKHTGVYVITESP